MSEKQELTRSLARDVVAMRWPIQDGGNPLCQMPPVIIRLSDRLKL